MVRSTGWQGELGILELRCVKFVVFKCLLTKRLCIEQDHTVEGHNGLPKTQAFVILVPDHTTPPATCSRNMSAV